MQAPPRRKQPPATAVPAPLDGLGTAKLPLLASLRHPGAALASAFFLLAIFNYSEELRSLAETSFSRYATAAADALSFYIPPAPPADPNVTAALTSAAAAARGCDVSTGEWIYDANGTVPLYREEQCSFLTLQVTCIANGRADDMYQRWRWQPKGCSLPQFDARVLMDKLRGKRLLFVGDSLNRNQWESLVCLVQGVLSRGAKSVIKDGSLTIFRAREYNATIEFYWAPFLVESNSDDPNIHSIEHRIIRAESIEKHARHWKSADYLIFNTYIWWMNTPKMKVRKPGSRSWQEHEEIERIDAYGMVMKTWLDWVDRNVDPARTPVFFMSFSPLHLSPSDWGNPDGIRCALETTPVMNYRDPIKTGIDEAMYDLVTNRTQSMTRMPITFIDITRLSAYRKDAHTQVYTVRQGKLLNTQQKADPFKFADCIHWCLPGLPDTWNQILYLKILARSIQS